MFKDPLIKRFVVWFFLINSLVFCLVGISYLHNILSSDSLFVNFNTHLDYHTPGGRVFVLLFTFINYVCYMTLLAAIPAVFLLLLTMLIPSKRLIFFISPLLASLCVFLLLLDSRLYAMFHFHLNGVIVSLIFNKHWLNVFEFSSLELTLIAGLIVFILIFQYTLAALVWKQIIKPGRVRTEKTIGWIWLGGSLYCYLALCLSIAQNNNIFSQQIPALPLYTQLFSRVIPVQNATDYVRRHVEADFMLPAFSGDRMRYPLHPLQCKTTKPAYNIILIMIDSLRFDALQKTYMPNMTRFAENSWQFKRYLSAGNGTQPGVFSLFYSLPSTYFTATLEQKISPALINEMIRQNYSVHAFWSAEMESPNFNDTVFQRFPQFRRDGAPGEEIPDKDQQITREAQDFLATNPPQSPFFISLFYDAVHGYCSRQNIPEIYQPTSACFRFNKTNDTDPTPERNRYLNALRFVDLELDKLLATIEQLGYLNNSIVILTSDHGEEFNDNRQNYWGHTSNFTNAQVHVPLVVHWPGQAAGVIDYETSSYDIVPTLMQDVFSCSNPVEDYSVGQNLLSRDGRRPFVLAGSYINVGLIEQNRLTTLQTSGQITITDKQARPLRNARPEMTLIQQALVLMRKYYVKSLDSPGL